MSAQNVPNVTPAKTPTATTKKEENNRGKIRKGQLIFFKSRWLLNSPCNMTIIIPLEKYSLLPAIIEFEWSTSLLPLSFTSESGYSHSSAHVAVHCSALQCVAVCCSVLQCVAVCCSVLSLSFTSESGNSHSPRHYESCKIFKGRLHRNAFSKLVHCQYKSFPSYRFCQVEI